MLVKHCDIFCLATEINERFIFDSSIHSIFAKKISLAGQSIMDMEFEDAKPQIK